MLSRLVIPSFIKNFLLVELVLSFPWDPLPSFKQVILPYFLLPHLLRAAFLIVNHSLPFQPSPRPIVTRQLRPCLGDRSDPYLLIDLIRRLLFPSQVSTLYSSLSTVTSTALALTASSNSSQYSSLCKSTSYYSPLAIHQYSKSVQH